MATRPAVGLSDAVAIKGIRVSLVGVTTQQVAATTPGELAGLAAVVRVRVTNETGRAIDLSSASVTFIDGRGQAGVPTVASPAKHFAGQLGAGGHADATYVFTLPQGLHHQAVQIYVSYSAGATIAHFRGVIA